MSALCKTKPVMKRPDSTHVRLIACHDCDLLHEYQVIGNNRSACCARCGATLYTHKVNSLERALALVLAALCLWIIAITFPFLALRMEGHVVHTSLITGMLELYRQDMLTLALLVFLTSILVPILEIACLLYVLLPLHFRQVLPYSTRVFRLLHKLEPWSMMEVFMLGLLVSVVKLNSMAEIITGVALWSFVLLIFLLAFTATSLDTREVWDRLGSDGDR